MERLLRNPHVDLTLGGCECIPECTEWGHKAEIECQIQAVNRLHWYSGKWFYQFSWSVIGAAKWTAGHLRGCVFTKLSCSKVLIMICNGMIVNSREGEEIWGENGANEPRTHLCWPVKGCVLGMDSSFGLDWLEQKCTRWLVYTLDISPAKQTVPFWTYNCQTFNLLCSVRKTNPPGVGFNGR